jgi:hypothetical protein
MGYIVLDPVAVKQLASAREATEIRDEIGRIVGIFQPATEAISSQSRAELEARRANRSGKRLDEVLAGLARQ